MPIRFSVTLADLAKITAQSKSKAKKDLSEEGFVYKHMNNGSGICPECAPWLGMHTTGDGSDGVPVPPQHPRCKCFLMKAGVAIIDDIANGVNLPDEITPWISHFTWMKTLSKSRLATIVGKVRANLIFDNKLEIEDLYEGNYLRSLADLGYSSTGKKLDLMMKPIDVISDQFYYPFIESFHNKHYRRLPVSVRGSGPGSPDGVSLIVARAATVWSATGRLPLWLKEFLVLLHELLPDDATLSH